MNPDLIPDMLRLPATHPLHQQALLMLSKLNGNSLQPLSQSMRLSQDSLQSTPDVKTVKTEPHDEVGRMAKEGVEEKLSDEIFASYRHWPIVPGCLPHPGDIVEAGPLAHLSLPSPWYPIVDSLPREAITTCQLSSLQLEGILYACQRHQVVLANGNRAGFFIGDGAGVGKGRQIAGIVMDNFTRGRTKHIWFSISSDLIVDARRDISDIGCFIKVIDGCQELDRETRVFGISSEFKDGIVFSTYATLVSSVQRGGSLSGSKHSRLQQLIDWCGGAEFEGCLVFDECHKAKNFVPGKEHASTKVAVAVMTIQRMLPKARVLYCSATGVTDVKNMAFMERLGLWGEGAPFKSFDHFHESVQRKGLGVAEMLAMEMKTSGMYVSRGLSFKQAEFLTVEAALTKDQKKMYNSSAHVWNELRKAMESAIVRTGCPNTRIWAQFWGSHQRFFKQMCMGMKVPTIVKEATAALESGQCVVIGLQTTGEASLESELGKNKGSVTGFVSLCREIYTRYITQYFPVAIEGAAEGAPKEDSWSLIAKKMLLEFSTKIQFPNSPLDEIIDKLGGPDRVAEMTGRRGRVVRRSPKEEPRYELRADSDGSNCVDSLNVRERNLFMEGKKFVAIISDAASTGISLHADLRVANQRRRVHLTVELPWSADKAVQQLGRSHRSNQSSAPLYKLITTDLGGERRFAAAVAKRLQSLGALTKGDRRAASGVDLTEFNFDTPYGRQALKTMYHHICQKELVPGVNLSSITPGDAEFEEFNMAMQESLVLMALVDLENLASGSFIKDQHSGDVGKFLNRVLGLSVQRQFLIFNYFSACLNVSIQNARKEGRYNEGLLDITASSVEIVGEPREIFKNNAQGNTPTKHIVLNIDRGLSWESALTRRGNYEGKDDGFYVSRRDTFGRKLYILATQKENSTHLFKLARPNTGVSSFDEEKTDVFLRYIRVTPEKAEEGWKEQYKRTEERCMHGDTCRNGSTCTVGSRCYRIHLLSGSIVTLMSLLEVTLKKFGPQLELTKSESNLRVVRVQLNNGERVVGLRYPEILIPEVENQLRDQNAMQQLQQNYLQQSQLSVQIPNTKSSQCEIDPVVPVKDKYYSKATTPPVTIRNYFKSASKDIEHSSIPEGESKKLTNESCSRTPNTECRKRKLESRQSENGFADENEQPSNEINADITLEAKQCILQPLKKRKQVSLLSSFAKQDTSKTDDSISTMNCPICSKEFPSGTFTSVVNKHVDQCLTE